MSNQNSKWLCCQIGAREHYAVPRALKKQNALDKLFTDAWVKPGALSRLGTNGFKGRFHADLVDADVVASNLGAVRFEMKARVHSRSGWDLITERNEWFQRFVLSELRANGLKQSSQQVTIFAYSYAAEGIFKFAREQGWRTVLGQIDPGPLGERLAERAASGSLNNSSRWRTPPESYWDQWRSEIRLADHVVVNSSWSRDALVLEGVPSEKIKVIPLAFEKPDAAGEFTRDYPEKFRSERPLRVLFLGNVSPLKGVNALFDAIKLAHKEPIEFWFVGPVQIEVPADLRADPRVKWFDAVPRDSVAEHYRNADVFIFPTLSDGFGLTQLEAQSWKLPVIASRYCGSVVQDEINGLLLDEVSGSAIADALMSLCRSPQRLVQLSSRSEVSEEFSLRSLASSLMTL